MVHPKLTSSYYFYWLSIITIVIYESFQHINLPVILIVKAAPINDVCRNAIPFTVGSTLQVDMASATVDTIDLASPTSDCIDNGDPLYRGVWYTITGTGGSMVARSCLVPFVYITIFTGGCDAASRVCSAATFQACDRERFVFQTTVGTTYHVFVQSYAAGIIDLSILPILPVTNDLCSSATPFPLIGSSIIVDTTFATSEKEFKTPTDDCIDNGDPLFYPGVWYTLIGTGQRLIVQSCNIEVTYTSIISGGCNLSPPICIAATTHSCFNPILFTTTVGTTYHILVQTFFEGNLDLSISVAATSSPIVPATTTLAPIPVLVPLPLPVQPTAVPIPVTPVPVPAPVPLVSPLVPFPGQIPTTPVPVVILDPISPAPAQSPTLNSQCRIFCRLLRFLRNLLFGNKA